MTDLVLVMTENGITDARRKESLIVKSEALSEIVAEMNLQITGQVTAKRLMKG